MYRVMLKRTARTVLVFAVMLSMIFSMLPIVSAPTAEAAGNDVPYEVAAGGLITLIGTLGSGNTSSYHTWTIDKSTIATVTKDSVDFNTAAVQGKPDQSGTVVVTHTYATKVSSRGTVTDSAKETFTIHFGPAVDKTVHWIEEGKSAEIVIQSIQTKEGVGIVPRVLFLGSLCSSHSLETSGVKSAINSLAKVADVDYYFYGLKMSDLSGPSSAPTTGSIARGGTFNKTLSTGSSMHISHFYFSEILASDELGPDKNLSLDDYDLIVLEFDGVRMADMGSYSNHTGLSQSTIASYISKNHYSKSTASYSKHYKQTVTYADLEADLAAAAIRLVDAYAEDKVAWLLPENVTSSGNSTEGGRYIYDDKDLIGGSKNNADMRTEAWDALAIMVPEIWLAKDAEGNYIEKKGTQPTTNAAVEAAVFNDGTLYRQRAADVFNNTTKEGLWTTYDNGSSIAALAKAKSEDIVRFQDVNITDIVADGFAITGIKGQYLDETTNPPEWKYIDPATGYFQCSFLDENVDPAEWKELDLTAEDYIDDINGSKIKARYDLGKLKSEKTRLILELETSEEIHYVEDAEGNMVVATNVGDVTVVYDNGTYEDVDDPPVLPKPGFEITKIANPASGETVYTEDVVEYYFKVKNIGELTSNSVRVTDELLGYDKTFTTTLEPGKTLVIVDTNADYTAQANETVIRDSIPKHTVNDADYAAGSLFNAAKLEVLAGNVKIYDESDTEHPVRKRAFRISKTSDYDGKSADEPVKEGQTITYTVTVRNICDATITDIVVDDSFDGAQAVAGTGYTVDANDATKAYIASLAVGDTVNVTYRYTVTAADVDAYSKDGVKLVNTVYVTGSDDTFGDASCEDTPEIKKVSVNAEKVWNDDDDRDGFRPDSVDIQLYKQIGSGAKTAVADATLTLSDANSWKGAFTDLLKYEDGEAVAYSVEEVRTTTVNGTDGPGTYSIEVTGDAASGYTVTNTHTPETLDISGSKNWNDAEYVGKTGYTRPDVTINLYEKIDGETNPTYVKSVTVTADDVDGTDENKWNWVFEDLYKYRDGKPVTYSVTETSVDGYETPVIIDYDVTNTPVPKTDVFLIPVYITVKKVDSATNTGSGLEGAKFRLEQKQEDGSYTTLDDDIVTNDAGIADIAFNEAGEYLLTETEAPEGYELGDPARSYTIVLNKEFIEVKLNAQKTFWQWIYSLFVEDENLLDENNTLIVPNDPETIDVDVEKVWDDGDDRDGIRPDSVEVQLYRSVGGGNDTVVDGKKLTLDEKNDWQGTFEDLPKREDGSEIVYMVQEVNTSVVADVDGVGTYAVDVAGNETDGFTVTNTHTPEKTSVSVSKVWSDDDDRDGFRPDSVEIRLCTTDGSGEKTPVTGKTLTLSEGTEWKGTFTDLYKYENGEAIVYSVDETKTTVITGTDGAGTYSLAVTGDAAVGYTVTNTHTPEKVDISGTKVWDDAEYVGKTGYARPEITINLYANGGSTPVDSVTVTPDDVDATEDNKWNWSFKEQYKYENGAEIDYTVTETSVDGFTSNVDDFTVTNTPVPKTDVFLIPVCITLKKVDSATGTGAGLPGAKFTLEQKTPGGYTMIDDDLVTGDDGTAVMEFNDEGEYRLTEIEAPEGYELNDPASYTIVLNKKFIEVKLNEGRTLWDWFYSLFTADENQLDENGMLVIPNPSEKTEVSVEKVWNDGDDRDGIRPDSVEIQLYRKVGVSGSDVVVDGKKLTLDESNDWEGTFEDLPKREDGQTITYSVREIETSVITGADGAGTYAMSVAGSEAEGFTVTNTHTPEKLSVPVSKVWNDGDDRDRVRPDSVEIQLYKQVGTGDRNYAADTTLNAAGNWQYTFADLYKYENGEAIAYSIVESSTDVITGTDGAGTYSDAISGDAASGYTVTNTHTPETVNISGAKVWNDAEYVGKTGYERPSITINLYGKTEDEATATIVTSKTVSASDVDSTDANKWNWSFENQYKYKNGKPITYTVTETSVDGYEEAAITDFTVTNTPVAKEDLHNGAAITIKKVDSAAPAGAGLPGAKFKLEKKGEGGAYVTIKEDIVTGADGTAKVEIEKEGEYRLTETKAPAGYDLGSAVKTYNIKFDEKLVKVELDAQKTLWQWLYGLFSDNNELDENNVLAVPNDPVKTRVDVKKVWDDDNDRDKIRPASVEIQLYKKVGTGSETAVDGKKITLNEAGNWEGSFEGLAKYAEGQKINYSIREVKTAVITDANSAGTYDIIIEGSEADGFIVTNKHTPITSVVQHASDSPGGSSATDGGQESANPQNNSTNNSTVVPGPKNPSTGDRTNPAVYIAFVSSLLTVSAMLALRLVRKKKGAAVCTAAVSDGEILDLEADESLSDELD